MNQQRQPITETRYPIDQTIPHQLVVSKILGALMCHPAFRIIQHDGARPFVTPTDALADLRGACDIAVSLDGSMNYGVVIEAKTTAHSDGGAWKIFKAVREERRNALQFERLVNAAPRWWYLIVRTDKLTAKTHEEHDRNLLDCPAILVDGKQGDQVPEDFIGPLRFGEMLQLLGDRLHISSSTPIKMPSRGQLEFPIDDVPAVTMDTPLKVVMPRAPSESATEEQARQPQQSPNLIENANPHRAEKISLPRLSNERIEDCLAAMSCVKISTEEIKSRMNADELCAYDEIMKLFSADNSRFVVANMIRRMVDSDERGTFSTSMLEVLDSEIALLSVAVYIVNYRMKQKSGSRSRYRHNVVFAEFVFQDDFGQRKNIANMVANRLCQK